VRRLNIVEWRGLSSSYTTCSVLFPMRTSHTACQIPSRTSPTSGSFETDVLWAYEGAASNAYINENRTIGRRLTLNGYIYLHCVYKVYLVCMTMTLPSQPSPSVRCREVSPLKTAMRPPQQELSDLETEAVLASVFIHQLTSNAVLHGPKEMAEGRDWRLSGDGEMDADFLSLSLSLSPGDWVTYYVGV